MKEKMKKTVNILRYQFWGYIIVSLALVIIYENDLLSSGFLYGRKQLEFILQMLMILVTLGGVYMSLKLFAIKSIKEKLHRGAEKALIVWGSWRIGMLGLPMMVNVILYYAYMNPAFGYMAIIQFIAMFFIIPTRRRSEYETGNEDYKKE